ncbi:organic solute transporter ostalpha domain-containing protein [Ditylenchus destructor]|uniref:Organic solute transporter ostalpha domain-containing protein n=1 Tax=Ditylenchus destructor TaxID=166010 RepID=A0AAD4R7H7_9BILA|nr:organic solute transporter ostalpha domain-containing protein [Ditylenchus destructor]
MGSFGDFLMTILRTILTLLIPQNIEVKCIPQISNETDPPSATVFLQNLQSFQIVFLAVGSVLTFAVLSLAVVQFYHVWMYISSEERRNNMYFLVSLFPVSTACCLIGMYCPRTAILLSSFGLLYFLTCLFILVSFIQHLSQGRSVLSRQLTERGKRISFKSPPLCCFLSCLPEAKPTESNLVRLEWIVLQAPIVRVFIVIGQVIAVAEARENALKWLHLFDLASLASLLLAIFGIHTLARVTSDQLSQFGFSSIFRVVDVSLLFFSAQQPILFQNILLRFGVIHCGPVLSPHDNARFICNFVIICELFILSLFSTFLVSPRRNNLFDLYRDKRVSSATISASSDQAETCTQLTDLLTDSGE